MGNGDRLLCLGSLWLLLCLFSSQYLLETGVVANHHHAEQGSSYLSHPAETPEDEEGRSNKAEHAHARDISTEKVAEEIAEHIATIAT